MSDDAPEVIVCAGPPDYLFEGDEAIANAQAGCPRCRRINLGPGGAETERQTKPQ